MRVAVVASAICVSIVGLADARGATSGTEAEASPGDSNSEPLTEITVTAQRRAERLQDVPISISVLSGGDLDKSSLQGVSAALSAVPGVAVTQGYVGGGSNIAIRGVASFPLFSGASPVAYYVDSVPFGLIKSAIGPDADAYDLERVEVLRGPQGTLYGASALNGVVRILTHDPEFNEFDVKSRVSDSGTEYGGNNYRADATVNVPLITDMLAARATVGYQSNSGWIDQPDKENANDSSIANYRLKLAAKPTDALSIGLSAWSSRQNADAPDLGHSFDKNSSLLDQPTSTKYDAYGLKIGYRTSDVEISGSASYLDFRNEGTLGADVPGFGVPGATFTSQLTSNIASGELNLSSTGAGPWRWSAGAMYRRGTEGLAQSLTVIPVPPSYYLDTSTSYAVYGELTRVIFGGKVELTAGVRHFHDDIDQNGRASDLTPFQYASSTAEANTPRGLITWHVNDRMMAYGSYSEGFRSGFPQNPLTLVALPTFPAVRPDRLKNYEVGTKGTLMNGLVTYDAALYRMNWQDIQLQVFTTAYGLPVPAIANGASARGNGADFAFTVNLGAFSLSPYVSWNDLAVSGDVSGGSGVLLYHRGDRPTGSIETTAGLAAGYSVPVAIGALKFSASASYSSPSTYRSVQGAAVLVQEANSVPDYRASAALDFATHWTATLYGDNLSNWRGTPAIMYPGVVPDYDLRLRPRTVGLQVEYRLH